MVIPNSKNKLNLLVKSFLASTEKYKNKMLPKRGGKEYSILIPGNPRSINARSKKSKQNLKIYKRKISEEASKISRKPLKGEVEVTIIHFYKKMKNIDIDNFSKPILDSLKGIAYGDDRQVVDLHHKQINLDAPRKIENVTSDLIPEALTRKNECVLIVVKPIS